MHDDTSLAAIIALTAGSSTNFVVPSNDSTSQSRITCCCTITHSTAALWKYYMQLPATAVAQAPLPLKAEEHDAGNVHTANAAVRDTQENNGFFDRNWLVAFLT